MKCPYCGHKKTRVIDTSHDAQVVNVVAAKYDLPTVEGVQDLPTVEGVQDIVKWPCKLPASMKPPNITSFTAPNMPKCALQAPRTRRCARSLCRI
jgi:hypothetical protein